LEYSSSAPLGERNPISRRSVLGVLPSIFFAKRGPSHSVRVTAPSIHPFQSMCISIDPSIRVRRRGRFFFFLAQERKTHTRAWVSWGVVCRVRLCKYNIVCVGMVCRPPCRCRRPNNVVPCSMCSSMRFGQNYILERERKRHTTHCIHPHPLQSPWNAHRQYRKVSQSFVVIVVVVVVGIVVCGTVYSIQNRVVASSVAVVGTVQ
jgi:hypothetical protein